MNKDLEISSVILQGILTDIESDSSVRYDEFRLRLVFPGITPLRLPKRFLFACLILSSLLGLLVLPATTRQGYNAKVTTRHIPLMIKAMDFLVRDYEYRDLATRLTRGLTVDEEKADAVLRWTQDHIRPVPAGWPVVDDHISHIMIRGYGQEDQMADVFTTLATYSGVPSFWKIAWDRRKPGFLTLSFVKIGGRWTVWDVAAGVAFRDAKGRLLSVEELSLNPKLLDQAITRVPHRANSYPFHVRAGLSRFGVPGTLRAEKQMPLRRIVFELKKRP